MLRFKLFHEFLWYLTRYNGKNADNEPVWKDYIPSLTVKKCTKLTFLFCTFPVNLLIILYKKNYFYLDSGDKPNEGWCLSGEVLTLIPLNLLCSIYQIRYTVN